jgi:hypothetical protein
MDFSAHFDAIRKHVDDAKAATQAAATESRDKLRQRIDEVQDTLDQTVADTQRGASEGAADAQSRWAQMKADAAARRDDIKAKIDKRTRQTDAKVAANEADAVAALDYAAWTVDNARLAVLDAIDARVYADQRDKLAGSG